MSPINLNTLIDRDQLVVLTINEKGAVTNMQNLWNSNQAVTSGFDPKYPCNFTTPVDKGKTIKWIGLADSNNTESVKISIDYVLMINGKGKQILKSKTYGRGSDDTVLGQVKKGSIKKGDIEFYYIIYSVDGKAFILDPRIEIHGL